MSATSMSAIPVYGRPAPVSRASTPASLHEVDDFVESARAKRLRSLLGLFVLYATALLAVIFISDGADVGCILAAIAGHVLYTSRRLVLSWRDASSLDAARARRVARV